MRPKPSLCWRTSSSLLLSFCFEEYSGSSRTLVHVRAVGRMSLSAQCLSTTNLQLLRPLIGARSVPVTKNRKDFFFSRSYSSTIYHSHFMTWVSAV